MNMQAPPAKPTRSLALGIERLGLISLRFPAVAAIILIILAVLGGFGVARLKVDDFAEPALPLRHAGIPPVRRDRAALSLERIRRARRRRGQGRCSRAKHIEKLRDRGHRPAAHRRYTRGSSRFSRRASRPRAASMPPPLFPDELPQGADYDKLVARVKSNEIIRGKLLSEDGKLALIVLALDAEIVATDGLRTSHRRGPQHARAGPRRRRPYERAFRRAGDAARNPQRGRARPPPLQRDRLLRRLPASPSCSSAASRS